MKNYRNNSKLAIIAVLTLLFLGSIGLLYSYYYSEDFSSGSTGWDLMYQYGRAGITRNATTTTMAVNTGGTGTLEIRNEVNDDDWDYLGLWCGRMALYNATSFNASVTNPFGVVFRRTYARIDSHDDSSNPESHRHISAQSFWFISADSLLDDDNDSLGTSYDKQIVMYDMMRLAFNVDGSNEPFSTWGYYQGSEQKFDLTTAVRPTGATTNIIGDPTYTLEWNYDDYWGADYATGGTANGNPDNNNPVLIKMTHDGSTVRFYINPDPDDANPYPNEFLLVGQTAVTWSDNLYFMMGMESKRYDTEMQAADIDSVLVRSVASSLTAEISPAKINKGSTNDYEIVVAPSFSGDDSGIGELTIKKPAAYDAYAWTPPAVTVYSFNGTGTAHGTLTTLKEMTTIAIVPTVDDEAYVFLDGDGNLKIRFRQTDDANNGVIDSTTGSTAADKKIVIKFNLGSLSTADGTGESFEVYANLEKYDGQDFSKYSTTGRMQAAAGDGYTGTAFSDDTLTVKRYGNPDVLMNMSPTPPAVIYIGNNRTVYMYLSATNASSPDISEVRIQVPDGFVPSFADSTRFSSLNIADDDSHVFATNEGGTNFIYVRYEADGGGLPSPGGVDRITMQFDQTPSGFSGAETNSVWLAKAYSSISGTAATSARTNAMYPNDTVTVRLLPPDFTGVVQTDLIISSTNYLYNHIGENEITYTIKNNGDSGNVLKKVRVYLPVSITNVSYIDSSLISDDLANAVYHPSGNYLEMDYQTDGVSLDSGMSDSISFNIYDSVTPMSAEVSSNFTTEADNGNGDGFVAGSEGVGSWAISWVSPPADGNANIVAQNSISSGNTNNIYTSGETTSIKLSLNNSGGLYNNIKMARITIPAVFTNSDFIVTSAIITNDAVAITTAGNVITLDYSSSANGYLENVASDTINFTVVDNVGLSAAGSETFVVEVANSLSVGDLQPTGDLGLGNKIVNFIYPPVTATATITPTEINTADITNTLTCVIVNNGDYENYIGSVKIHIPDTMASNVLEVGSLSTHTGLTVDVDPSGSVNFVSVMYNGVNPLYGGQSDTITFKMVDNIIYKTNFSLVVEASNINNSFVKLFQPDASTNSILFQIPPAKASAKIQPEIIFTQPDGMTTNVFVVIISNEGTLGNEITNAIITLPAIFGAPNNIFSISNDISDAGLSFGGGSAPINVYYTNHLMPGETDKVYLFFKNEHTAVLADLAFGVTVDNGEGAQAVSLISGGSLTGDLVDRATVSFKHDDVANPQQIYTTISSSDFVYTLKNGAVGGRSIKQVLIDIPAPFTTTSLVVTSGWPGATSTVTNGNQILIDYSANDFDAGSTETVNITASDSLVEGITNVNWTSKVDYGDGYGFRDTVIASGKSINIAFVFPDAEAYAAISPSLINSTVVSSSYTVDITNIGVTGNKILLATVELPAVITNVTAFSSAINGVSSIFFSNDNKIYINYDAEANSIVSGGSDQISFTGFDEVSDATNYGISVKVANSTNSDKDYYKVASPQVTGGLTLSYFRPDFGAVAYIVPTTPVSGSLPQSVLSTVAANSLSFTIVNTGAPGNDLQKLEIEIPLGVFSVNSITNNISSTKLGNLTGDSRISLSNNILTIEYKTNVSEQLQANESDTISFIMEDTITSTEVNTFWKSVSYFTTSGVTPLTNGVATGQTNMISLIMPDPVSMARVLQNSVYTTTTNFSFVMDITNSGSGTDDLTEVKITVPTGFQAGLSLAVMTDIVTNSFADTISYSSGEIILTYSTFTVGKNDRLYINFANGYSAVDSLSFTLVADNGVKSAATSEWTPNALKFAVVTPPSSYLVTPAWTANLVYSTRYNDTYRIYLRNDGTGTDELKRAKLIFPEGFVFISSNSTKSGDISISSNVVTIDYSGSPIGASEYDELEFDAVAPFFAGTTNISIEVITGDVDPSALNSGYSSTRLYTGKSWTVNYTHPAVEAEFYLDDYAAGDKPSIIVAPRDGIAMTNLSVEIANNGNFSNAIYSLQLDIPTVFSAISNYSSVSGGVVTLAGNQLTINYSGSGLSTGSSDIVSFDLYYALADSTNNLLFSLVADNSDGNGYIASTIKVDQFNTLDVKYPPIAIFAGVYDVDSIYTISTNTIFTYKVKNRAQGYEIYRTVITNVNWALFDSFVVTSASGDVITNATSFEVYYTNGTAGLQFNDVDNITVNLYYNISNNNVTTLTLKNIAYITNKSLSMSTNVNSLALVAIDTATGYANNQQLTVGPAPFGNVYGTVTPNFKVDNDNNSELLPNIVKVEVLKLTEDTVVATPYDQEVGLDGTLVNKSLQGYSVPDSGGYYSLDYIPAGDYRLRLTAAGFRKMVTNFTVSSNIISSLPNFALENSFLDADGGSSQLVVDYTDTNTSFILPKGGILDQFSLDISVIPMTTTQKGNVVANSLIKAPSTTVDMGCFKFTIRDSADIELSGMGIGGDGILNFHYTTTNLNLPIPADWSESDLAVYYWKETTEEWVPLGGLLNTTDDIISAKISYLHRYYATLSKSSAAAKAGEIYNVKASPNPFTPGRGGENFNKVKLTFSFKNAHATYEVKIYRLDGKLVKQFKNDGSYAQGEVFWDGKDANSFGLPGGVYLYQIKAGGEVFTGTVLMLK